MMMMMMMHCVVFRGHVDVDQYLYLVTIFALLLCLRIFEKGGNLNISSAMIETDQQRNPI